MSAAERASEASNVEQVNEWAVRVNEWMSGPVLRSRFLTVLHHCALAGFALLSHKNKREKPGKKERGKFFWKEGNSPHISLLWKMAFLSRFSPATLLPPPLVPLSYFTPNFLYLTSHFLSPSFHPIYTSSLALLLFSKIRTSLHPCLSFELAMLPALVKN